jgi:hypothetical protein
VTLMKKRPSYFAYNERSRSGWTLTIPLQAHPRPIRSTMKTVTYVPGTFVTLVSGLHNLLPQGEKEQFLDKSEGKSKQR